MEKGRPDSLASASRDLLSLASNNHPSSDQSDDDSVPLNWTAREPGYTPHPDYIKFLDAEGWRCSAS